MANTKSLSSKDRKASKRVARAGLKNLVAGLDRKDRRTFRKEKKGIKTFVAEKKAAAAEE